MKARYSDAAQARETSLCCPIDYDKKYLEVLPSEIIERDYGCGDPSKYLNPGETVLDLGSGGGKICYIASQVVGPTGKVIGVDMNDDMLALARKYKDEVGQRIGWHNVDFRKGRIQDMKLDLELLDQHLQAHPVQGVNAFMELEEHAKQLRQTRPLVPTESVDVVVSNCVLNLVDTDQKKQLFQEIYRVLRNGGRAVISDIVCDEEVPLALQQDADLWSGCASGAMTEDGFLQAFVDAGFYGVRLLKRDSEPWQTLQGIELRSYTVEAFKGKFGPCLERNQAVIYTGPFFAVEDDDNHRLVRGKRYAVCEKTFNLYHRQPYAQFFQFVEPLNPVPREAAQPFPCGTTRLRHPRETKGFEYNATSTGATGCCTGEKPCCGGEKVCSEEAKTSCCGGEKACCGEKSSS